MPEYCYNEAEMSNICVTQKNKIYALINNGELVAASAALSVVRDLWEMVDYGYKFVEVKKRIQSAIDANVWYTKTISENDLI